VLHVGEELGVGRVIDRLETDYLRPERPIVLVQVVHELQLRGGGPDDEDLLGASELMRQRSEEPREIVRMLARLGRPLRMAMHVSMGRRQRLLVKAPEVDVEDSCFLVIEPDGGA